MKGFILWVLLIVLAGEVTYLYINNSKKTGQKVLAEATISPTASPTPSPTPTTTPTPTPSPTPKPTKKPTPVPTPSPATPSEINGLIDRFSSQYSVDPNVMRHIAICESGFNPNAVNGPYIGLYQFAATTWKNIRLEMGEDVNTNLRFSAEESAQTAAYAVSKGKEGIWPHCEP